MSGISTPQRATVVTLTTTAETSALVLPFTGGMTLNPSVVNLPGVGNKVNLKVSGRANITTGAATTSVQVRCRRGNGVTGTQVGSAINVPFAAATTDDVAFEFEDSAAPSGAPYTITVQQVAATGNGTVNEIVGESQDYN